MSSFADLQRTLRSAWLQIAVFSVIINLFLLVPSVYMMQVYDRVLPAASIPTLLYLSLIAAGSLAFLAFMEIIRSIYCQRVALLVDRQLGGAAFHASMNSPTADFGDTPALRDLSSVRSFIASRGLANLADLPFAPLFMVLLFFVHPVLCLITAAGAILMLLLVVANQLAARAANAKAQEVGIAANLLAQAFARNADTIRGMGMFGHVLERWGNRFAEAAMLQDRMLAINAAFSGISRALRMALQLAILCAGAVLVIRGEMTAGMIFASSIISGRALQPIDQLVAGWKQVVDARKAWSRLKTAIQDVNGSSGGRIELPEPRGQLSVKDLVWSPPNQISGSAPVLKRLNFEILPGEAVALLGPSGAGKSTLARVLAGVLHPTAGLVAMDGADYRTWNSSQLGRCVGYLAQEVQLLPGSIAQNIARFDPDATDVGITSAATRAEAHGLVIAQKQGYQTVINAAGTMLSGGTRQRIGLARAFYGDPKVLVLDEPNANLDAEGEAALEKALLQAKATGTTIIIVTHRPGIVMRCDKAMVLRDGSIDLFGAAPEILQRLSSKSARREAGQTFIRNPDSNSASGAKAASDHLALVHDSAE
ncbi:type I secretion system permease/ATPase [Rhizobium sp. WSM1325]|nr:type I secretion system permease/ATPase [Rhizobium leguminosarum]